MLSVPILAGYKSTFATNANCQRRHTYQKQKGQKKPPMNVFFFCFFFTCFFFFFFFCFFLLLAGGDEIKLLSFFVTENKIVKRGYQKKVSGIWLEQLSITMATVLNHMLTKNITLTKIHPMTPIINFHHGIKSCYPTYGTVYKWYTQQTFWE